MKIHSSAIIDKGAKIGEGTAVWHFTHICSGATIGKNCSLGQNVLVADKVMIGDSVKIQNNVAIYGGVTIEDEVFLGPSCVLTNVTNPRSQVSRKSLYEKTLFRKGATIGANATIICGLTLGRYCFVGAGSVVTGNIPDYGLVLGNPGRRKGFMSRHGHRLHFDESGQAICPESQFKYLKTGDHVHCLDLDEEAPLPVDLSSGTQNYKYFK